MTAILTVTKALGYASEGAPSDALEVSKTLGYAKIGAPVPTLEVAKLLGYAWIDLGPPPARRRTGVSAMIL